MGGRGRGFGRRSRVFWPWLLEGMKDEWRRGGGVGLGVWGFGRV